MKPFISLSVKFIMLGVGLLIIGGCSINDPTFIVDTSLNAVFEINEETEAFNESVVIDLNDLIRDVQGTITDINIFNVTLVIQRLGTTPENLTINGTFTIDDRTLLVLGDLPIHAFVNERSVFDQTLINEYDFNVDGTGLQYLLSMFDNLSPVTIAVSGDASGSPVHLLIFVTVHAQVSTE